MVETDKYGLLLNSNIKLHRTYFNEMVKLLGIQVIYRAPKADKHWTNYGEIESNYDTPIRVGCIFDEHPNQKTLKKIGWVAELQQNSSIIHVAYDLPNIQQGALFIIPSGLDNGKSRLFRVVELTNSIVYPASITCEIVPEYENTFENSSYDFSTTSFNLLTGDEDNL